MQVLELDKRGRAYRDMLRRFERYTVDGYLARFSGDELAEVVAALSKLKTAFDD